MSSDMDRAKESVSGGLMEAAKTAITPATWAAVSVGGVAGGVGGGIAGYQRAGIGLPTACTGYLANYASDACQHALATQRAQYAIGYGVSAMIVAFLVGTALAWLRSF
jgi:hypothetical protein